MFRYISGWWFVTLLIQNKSLYTLSWQVVNLRNVKHYINMSCNTCQAKKSHMLVVKRSEKYLMSHNASAVEFIPRRDITWLTKLTRHNMNVMYRDMTYGGHDIWKTDYGMMVNLDSLSKRADRSEPLGCHWSVVIQCERSSLNLRKARNLFTLTRCCCSSCALQREMDMCLSWHYKIITGCLNADAQG